MKLPAWLQREIAFPTITVSTLMLLISIMLTASVGIAALLARDPDWARWHISYLGEGDKLSAHFFNISLWVAAGLIVWLSVLFGRELAVAKCTQTAFAGIRPVFVTTGLIIMALCIYCVGLFPRSFGIFPHDIFGHAIYFVFLALCVASPWILPGMPRWFYAVSYGFHIAMLGLFVAYWTGASQSLYVAEIATFVFFFAWMALLVREMRA